MASCAAEPSYARARAFSTVVSGRYGGHDVAEEPVATSDELQVVSQRTFLELWASESPSVALDTASCCDSNEDGGSTCTPLDSESNLDEAEEEMISPPAVRAMATKHSRSSVWGKRMRGSRCTGSRCTGSPLTTLTLRNLPKSYKGCEVQELLIKAGLSHFDFIYVPVDFRNYTSYGYAFVNFSHGADLAIARLSGLDLAGTALEAMWCATHQGLEVHVRRYRNSPVMHPSVPEIYKPMIFHNGTHQRFPAPTKTLKAPRLRRTGCQ